jgi:DNA-binding GntR family transcriptional regulator
MLGQERVEAAEGRPQRAEQSLLTRQPLQEAEHVVRAVMPDAEIQEGLDMADAEPCLVVSRRTWAHGRPVSYARLYHPGSRFELSGHYVPPGTEAFSPAGERNND